MEIVAAVIEAVMGVMSAWLVVMLLYQLCISFFGFKRNTKNYQDHDPQMRFLVLVPAHNEEAVIADIIDNLEHMEYPRELYDFYILADNCTDRTVEVARRMGPTCWKATRKVPMRLPASPSSCKRRSTPWMDIRTITTWSCSLTPTT